MSGSSHAAKPKTPLLSNGAYDVLKRAVTIVLPALSTLYFTLAQIWSLPKSEEVVGTIAAVNTFLGVILGVSSKTYNNSDAKYTGEIQVEDTGERKVVSLVVNGDPYDLEHMNEATFKISREGQALS